MKRRIFLTLILGALANAAHAEEDQIPVMGIDAVGKTVQTLVSSREYSERMGHALLMTREASLSTLDRQSAREAKRKWRLRSAIIGVGVSGEIGFGPFKVAAYPRFRLVFSNSLNPLTP